MSVNHLDADRERPGSQSGWQSSEGVIWAVWATYGAFYFCRTNIAAAVPGMKGSVDQGGLGMSPEQVGYILGGLKIAYGLGQGLNGQLAEHVSPRRLLAVGMLGSAALNVLFGLSTGFYFLLFVWACNGYLQSLGWTPCMRVVANWIPILHRGRAIGIIGTGYQVTQVLTFLIAGAAAHSLGWRGALYVPAALLALAAVFMLLCLREQPAVIEPTDASTTPTASVPPSTTGKSAHPTSSDSSNVPAASVPAKGRFVENVVLTLSNPSLWLLGLALGLLNACRYGFLDWGLTHLIEIQKVGVGKAALQYAVLPLGAVAGSYLAGWATDRFFGGRRAPVIAILLVTLAGLALAYGALAKSGGPAMIVLLFVIGFCIYGPQVLLVGTAPTDLARRGTAAAAAGFVNFLGYMGAAAGDVITGSILKAYDWRVVIQVWSAWALTAALAAALLWNRTARQTD